jgi:predicted site-specific integrase-resolvase
MQTVNSEPVAWPVKVWCNAIGVSPAYFYELLNAGKIRTAKVGGKRLVLTNPRDFVEAHADKKVA